MSHATDPHRRQPPPPEPELADAATDSGTQRLETAGAASSSSAGDEFSFLAPAQSGDELGRLGHYRILKKLGKGGMGAVFLAEDLKLQRKAAVKVMLPKVAINQAAKDRFLREARTAAAVKHDHIVTIYQVDEDRGVPFIALEYLKGQPLDVFLKEKGPPDIANVLRIGREVAEGLAAAHEVGLIHRDIKPANIWLEAPNGRAKILDFGLARLESDNAQITGSGTVVGTPAFMAPEQGRGEKLDFRADLFSLGGVLYALCTGKPPFGGGNVMAVLLSLAMDKQTPAHEINPRVPPALSALIDRLLAKNAAERPQSAGEVARELRHIGQPPAGASGPMIVYVPMAVPVQNESSPWANIDSSVVTAPVSTSHASPAPRTPQRWLLFASLGGLVVLAAAVLVGLSGRKPMLATPTQPEVTKVEPEKKPSQKKETPKKETPQVEAPPPGAWRQLFNGKDMTGWYSNGKHEWKVVDGKPVLHLGADSLLKSEESHRDYHLSLEFQVPGPDAHASVAYHVRGNDNAIMAMLTKDIVGKLMVWLPQRSRLKPGMVRNGVIIPDPKGSTEPRWSPLVPQGGWNRLDIVCVGDTSLHVVNGNVAYAAAELRDADLPWNSGAFEIRGYAATALRNVQIRSIAALPAEFGGPKAAVADPTFFNGKDDTGWNLGTHFRLQDAEFVGTMPKIITGIGAKKKAAWTKRSYRDFELSFQVRHKDGQGQSGVLFRCRDEPTRFPGGHWMWNPQQDQLWVAGREDKDEAFLLPKRNTKRADDKRNEYSDVTLRCVGTKVTVRVNGVAWWEEKDLPTLPAEGIIGFRVEGSTDEIRYRNIRFIDLSRPAATE